MPLFASAFAVIPSVAMLPAASLVANIAQPTLPITIFMVQKSEVKTIENIRTVRNYLKKEVKENEKKDWNLVVEMDEQAYFHYSLQKGKQVRLLPAKESLAVESLILSRELISDIDLSGVFEFRYDEGQSKETLRFIFVQKLSRKSVGVAV